MEPVPEYTTNPEQLEALRKKLGELASDFEGTLAALPEDVQQQYRDAEQSVIDNLHR